MNLLQLSLNHKLITPINSLSTFVNQHKKQGRTNVYTISSLPSAKEFNQNQLDDAQYFYQAIGKLWRSGYNIDWSMVWKTAIDQFKTLPLPGYQFEKNRCWIDLPVQSQVEEKQDLLEDSVTLKSTTNQDQEKRKILFEEDATEFEDSIAHIFSQVLGNDSFSKYDSFFDIITSGLSFL